MNPTLLHYPKFLNKIFDKLDKYNIKPIFIGGYVRDSLLGIASKDIDIELYGVYSFQELENILQEFGPVNSVGKSFGVCKLSLKNLEIDFTLPRHDNKIAPGHSGFLIATDSDLDFKTASSRRDFTMNAIGFDVKKQIYLDPFNGKDDIAKKIIRAIDLDKFSEDPLRVFRAVSFSSRLNFTLDDKLFSLCKNMCEKNMLLELPRERIYSEVKKILLKSSFPSIAFILLKNLNGLKYLHPLDSLSSNDFSLLLTAIDRLKTFMKYEDNTSLYLLLSILSYKFSVQETISFIKNTANESKLLSAILRMKKVNFQENYTDTELLMLATQINIELFLIYSQALNPDIDSDIFSSIKKRALELHIFNSKQKEFLQGRDIINLGVKPSKQFSQILSLAYTKQLNLEIQSRKEALAWLNKYLT